MIFYFEKKVSMKKFTSPLVILSAATLFVVVPGATAAHAQCTNATLIGSYAMIWQDFTTKKALQGNEVLWAGIAVVTFDGAGNTPPVTLPLLRGVLPNGGWRRALYRQFRLQRYMEP